MVFKKWNMKSVFSLSWSSQNRLYIFIFLLHS